MTVIELDQITLPYLKEELQQWKHRDSGIVPAFILDWEGPGVSNGYGFGEWVAEKYFRNHGYYVLTNEFNLLSKTSKYERYNKIISTMVNTDKIKQFKEAVQHLIQQGISIENPDLFVFNLETCFFAEVKKEKDRLREPQLRFFYLAKQLLEIDSKLIYLSDTTTSVCNEQLTIELIN
ncbi:hypothetical protein H1D32_21000 [Anaerobacillus sp. CMMVII]|uniref:hypothetical protein n=1 Tax=Anaerobacillus sp. CMMVII TaxID=2755588 RepID=UPI0021B78017|nr:hypothetical protein [Anaerobacillus sp. CMMVII]MCT8139957.1 hypothetical protein [Anaerobacillus sp. CMMVII]